MNNKYYWIKKEFLAPPKTKFVQDHHLLEIQISPKNTNQIKILYRLCSSSILCKTVKEVFKVKWILENNLSMESKELKY